MLRQIVFFSYMFAVFLGIGAVSMVVYGGDKGKDAFYKSLRNFAGALLIVCFYDMLMYYTDYIIGRARSDELLRIGDCIIAVLFYFWVILADNLVGARSYKTLNKLVKIYCITYSLWWFAYSVLSLVAGYTGQNSIFRWALFLSDVVLLVIMLAACAIYIGEGVWSGQERYKTVFIAGVSALLSWNYIAYFWGELSMYFGNSGFIREPLDLTIVFWLIINIGVILLIVKLKANEEKELLRLEFDVDKAMENLGTKCQLTLREREVLGYIYEGMSNMQIAEIMFVTENTVKTHIYNIFRKTGVKNRIELTARIRKS